MDLQYKIGRLYQAPSGDIYKLIKVDWYVFKFDREHWCTDTVFMDYIDLKIGKMVCDLPKKPTQLKLF